MAIITLNNINKLNKDKRYLVIENICNNLGLELDNIIDFTLNGLTSDKIVVCKTNNSTTKIYKYLRKSIDNKLFEIEFTEKSFIKKQVIINKDVLIYKTNNKINKNLVKNCILNVNANDREEAIYLDNNHVLHVADYISDKNAIGYFFKSVGNIIIQSEKHTKYNLTINTLLSLMTDYYFYNISLSNLEEKIPLLYNSDSETFYISLYNTITIFRYLLSVYEKTYIPLMSIFIINDFYKLNELAKEEDVNILGIGFENKLNINQNIIEKVFKDIKNGSCFYKLPNYVYVEDI